MRGLVMWMELQTVSISTDQAKAAKPGPALREKPFGIRHPVLTKLAFGLGSSLLALLVWLALANSSIRGFPGPGPVATEAWKTLLNGTLMADLWASLQRVLLGYAIGVTLAVPVGFALGWYPIARRLFLPWLQFLRMIPPLAVIPLAIVLMGIGETPKIFVIFLAAFLAALVSTYQGVLSVDRTLINAARVLGAKDHNVFVSVVVPASTPFILVGMRVGLGAAWGTVVAAELIAAQAGLGFRMQQAQLYYDLPSIFVQLITIGLIGLAMDQILLRIEQSLGSWQERR
jgi:NitT/TauT family transport system permease protein